MNPWVKAVLVDATIAVVIVILAAVAFRVMDWFADDL